MARIFGRVVLRHHSNKRYFTHKLSFTSRWLNIQIGD
jgi:hypothetical protein